MKNCLYSFIFTLFFNNSINSSIHLFEGFFVILFIIRSICYRNEIRFTTMVSTISKAVLIDEILLEFYI